MRLTQGVGDRGGLPSSKNNKPIKSHKVWVSMLERCYSKLNLERQPSYKDCTVCDEWLYYPNFLLWFDLNYKKGMHLDKDLKNKGSKIYNPDNCSFIPSEINSLTISCGSSRGILPIGVTEHKTTGLYMSRLREYGVTICVGYFKCKKEAFNAYRERKLMYIIKVANSSFAKGDICDQVFANLIKWEIKYDD